MAVASLPKLEVNDCLELIFEDGDEPTCVISTMLALCGVGGYDIQSPDHGDLAQVRGCGWGDNTKRRVVIRVEEDSFSADEFLNAFGGALDSVKKL